jgi:hypothetical protein
MVGHVLSSNDKTDLTLKARTCLLTSREEKCPRQHKYLLFHLVTSTVFENRESRRIFWPKRDEVTGEWRKLHNEELKDLYCSPTIVRVIKSRRMR